MPHLVAFFCALTLILVAIPEKGLSDDSPCTDASVFSVIKSLVTPRKSFFAELDLLMKQRGEAQLALVTKYKEANKNLPLAEWEASLIARMQSKKTYPALEEIIAYEMAKSPSFEESLSSAFKNGVTVREEYLGHLRRTFDPIALGYKLLGKSFPGRSVTIGKKYSLNARLWELHATKIRVPINRPIKKEEFQNILMDLSVNATRAASKLEFDGIPGHKKLAEVWIQSFKNAKQSGEPWDLFKHVGDQLQKDQREHIERLVSASAKETFDIPTPDEKFLKQAMREGFDTTIKEWLIKKKLERKLSDGELMTDSAFRAEVKKISDSIRFLLQPVWEASGFAMLGGITYYEWRQSVFKIERERRENLRKLLSTENNPHAVASKAQVDESKSELKDQLVRFTAAAESLRKQIAATSDPAKKANLEAQLKDAEKRIFNLKRIIQAEADDEELLKKIDKEE